VSEGEGGASTAASLPGGSPARRGATKLFSKGRAYADNGGDTHRQSNPLPGMLTLIREAIAEGRRNHRLLERYPQESATEWVPQCTRGATQSRLILAEVPGLIRESRDPSLLPPEITRAARPRPQGTMAQASMSAILRGPQ